MQPPDQRPDDRLRHGSLASFSIFLGRLAVSAR
jgi:hypothetical protein